MIAVSWCLSNKLAHLSRPVFPAPHLSLALCYRYVVIMKSIFCDLYYQCMVQWWLLNIQRWRQSVQEEAFVLKWNLMLSNSTRLVREQTPSPMPDSAIRGFFIGTVHWVLTTQVSLSSSLGKSGITGDLWGNVFSVRGNVKAGWWSEFQLWKFVEKFEPAWNR